MFSEQAKVQTILHILAVVFEEDGPGPA